MTDKRNRRYTESRRRKRKNRRKKRILVFIIEFFILSALLLTGYVMFKYDKLQTVAFGKGDIKINTGIAQEGYTTIALFGGDSREGALEEGTHADTIIIAGINNKTKDIKLCSVYRDTLTKQEDGTLKKANNAYFVGGPKDAINLLNRNLDLDIQDYVTVDFKAMADVVDLLGGIEIDPTQAEVDSMNRYLKETAKVAKKEAHYVKSPGPQTFDGVQAVTYARIRKLAGGDFKRTERQRLVLEKMFEKVKQSDLKTLNKILDQAFGQVSTSFSLKELLKLAAGAFDYQLGETTGFPFKVADSSYRGAGSVVVAVGLEKNVKELHTFLYPDQKYKPSAALKEISEEIADNTGIYPQQSDNDNGGAKND